MEERVWTGDVNASFKLLSRDVTLLQAGEGERGYAMDLTLPCLAPNARFPNSSLPQAGSLHLLQGIIKYLSLFPGVVLPSV